MCLTHLPVDGLRPVVTWHPSPGRPPPHSPFVSRNQTFGAFVKSQPGWPLPGALHTDTLWAHREQIKISFMIGSGTRQQPRKVKVFLKISSTQTFICCGSMTALALFASLVDDDTPSQSQLGAACRQVPQDE
ncbi:hypothetical protein NLI96_g12358 [Meripilus lineatus]|uniref:Uncharacterized protein n=1 Tax=Meripilus lineatus TaxID=2056292 RepID=A0AAD5UQ23_9APHY|nr:hypothetical protein NLI96_g12358 [Physisporinus lineatus]